MELGIGVTAVVNEPRVAIHRAQLGHHVIRDSLQFPCLREDDRMQPGREIGIRPDLQGDPQQQRRLTATPRPDHDRVLVHSPAFRRAIPFASELLATHSLATSMLGTGAATSRPLVPRDAAWGKRTSLLSRRYSIWGSPVRCLRGIGSSPNPVSFPPP